MNLFFSSLIMLTLCISSLCAFSLPIKFAVIIPSYNNQKWCLDNLQSVFQQTYPHWVMLYVDDCSTDDTRLLAQAVIDQSPWKNKCYLLTNPKRFGAMANWYYSIHKFPPHYVIVNLDGDDKLADPFVLDYLAKIYQNGKTWLTYGNYHSAPIIHESYCHPFPERVLKNSSFRSYKWVSSHLRTYFAKLFHLIKKEDLQVDGQFLSVCCDVAMMYPMLEMASKGHISYIDKILYIYNTSNPISDFKLHVKLIENATNRLKRKPKYKPLDTLFTKEELDQWAYEIPEAKLPASLLPQ